MNVDVRAPRNGEYFRVNPDPASRSEVVLTHGPDGKQYLVAPAMVSAVEKLTNIDRCMMFTAQNIAGQLFLWPVTLPVPSDHPAWRAMQEWICLKSMH